MRIPLANVSFFAALGSRGRVRPASSDKQSRLDPTRLNVNHYNHFLLSIVFYYSSLVPLAVFFGVWGQNRIPNHGIQAGGECKQAAASAVEPLEGAFVPP